jgi:glycerol-3-phosphate dehydrogenase subunit C
VSDIGITDHIGRSQHEPEAPDVLGDLMRGTLDHCVKCTICETFCPVSNVTPLFPGPKAVGPQAERFRVRGEESVDHSLDYCSGCGVCTQVCPQGVHIAEINTQARAKLKERDGFSLRDRIIARPPLLGRAGTPAASLANKALANRPLRLLGEKVLGVHHKAAVPRFAGQTFQGWAKRHQSPPAPRRVAYFHGCGANWYEPAVGEKTVGLLEAIGCQVDVPRGQSCCGLPLQSNGQFEAARKYVRAMAKTLAPAARAGVDIVGTSTSCTLMLKREAREILDLMEDADLKVVSEHMYDICEYLVMLHDNGELPLELQPLPMTVTYHAPCQQQGHGVGKPALELMALIPDLRVIENDATCCGVAGTYGIKREKYEIAMKVGSGLFAQIQDARPDVAVCDSETCRWHIEAATGVRSVHPIELLHRAAGPSGDLQREA